MYPMVDLPNILYHDLSTDAGTRPPREEDDVVVEAADELFCRGDGIVVVVAADVHDDEVVADGSRPCRMTPIREAFRRTAIELNILLLFLSYDNVNNKRGRHDASPLGPLGVEMKVSEKASSSQFTSTVRPPYVVRDSVRKVR